MWSGIDRRKFPRANYPCKIVLKKKDAPSKPLSTNTENIGLGGICVMLPEDLGIFAPVEIQLDIMDGHPNIECDGTVAWIVPSKKEKKNESYDTGLEFTNLKRKDEQRIYSIVQRVVQTE